MYKEYNTIIKRYMGVQKEILFFFPKDIYVYINREQSKTYILRSLIDNIICHVQFIIIPGQWPDTWVDNQPWFGKMMLVWLTYYSAFISRCHNFQ